jgi:hypothetical protein
MITLVYRNGIASVVEFIPTLRSGQALSLPKDSLAMTGGWTLALTGTAYLARHCGRCGAQNSFPLYHYLRSREAICYFLDEFGVD